MQQGKYCLIKLLGVFSIDYTIYHHHGDYKQDEKPGKDNSEPRDSTTHADRDIDSHQVYVGCYEHYSRL